MIIGPARALTLVGAAAVLRRLAASLDVHVLARASTLIALVALAAAALHAAALARELRPGTRTSTDDVIDGWIALLTVLCSAGAQLGVVAVGLVIRSQWNASRAALGAPTEPNPAARQ